MPRRVIDKVAVDPEYIQCPSDFALSFTYATFYVEKPCDNLFICLRDVRLRKVRRVFAPLFLTHTGEKFIATC